MKKYKLIKLKSFVNDTGKLVPVDFEKEVTIKIKRIFYIFGKKNSVRGDHAHKKCYQLFFPIKGSVNLTFTDGGKKKTIKLNPKKNIAVLIYNLVWCKLKFLSKNSIIMVFCDREYEYKDYIEKLFDFKKILTKKK